MKYYIIYLLDGKVVDITSWDEELGRDDWFAREQARLDTTLPQAHNQIQKLDIPF